MNCSDTFEEFISLKAEKKGAAEYKAEIIRLYPDLDPVALEKKLKESTDAFLFFRTFVPLYYDLMRDVFEDYPLLKAMLRFTGKGIGDAHPENFAALYTRVGESVFMVDDLDDAAEGAPLLLDFLRFMSGVKLGESDVGRKKLFEHYLAGLKDAQPRAWSSPVKKMLEQSRTAGTKILKADVTETGTQLVRAEGARPLKVVETEAINKWLNSHSKRTVEVLDSMAFIRTGGGSGGRLRIRVLIRRAGKDSEVVEFKELAPKPGVFPVVPGTDLLKPAERERRVMESFYPPALQSRFSFTAIEGKDFLVRSRIQSNVRVALDDIDGNEGTLMAVLQDQAYLIGQLHRQASEGSAYVQELEFVGYDTFNDLAKKGAKKLHKRFDVLKNSPSFP